tara:strand:+ start:381 stop:1523 length:1143 start_codon:yes stop_codon:yes gene_type:complete
MINYSKQVIDSKEIRSVSKVLRSDYLTQGPLVKKFEKKISNYCNSKYAIAVSSATSGLHIACLSLDVKKNDIVWTSAISFVASANAAVYCNADIDFLDISLEDFNIDIKSLEKKLIVAKKKNKLPKVIIVVHFAGNPCQMKQIYSLKKKYKFKIIEDASHALGATYMNKLIGGCDFSDMCVFSFHPVKSITTAEGGVVTTNNKKIFNDLKLYREHGINRDFINKKVRPKYYEQIKLGYNYRMNELEAAIGIEQLKKLDSFITKRVKIYNFYKSKLKNNLFKYPSISANSYSSHHLFIIILKKNIRRLRDNIFSKLLKKGIGVNIHYMPIYKHPFYKKYRKKNFLLKNAEIYYNTCISIPIFPTLSRNQQSLIIRIINSVK